MAFMTSASKNMEQIRYGECSLTSSSAFQSQPKLIIKSSASTEDSRLRYKLWIS